MNRLSLTHWANSCSVLTLFSERKSLRKSVAWVKVKVWSMFKMSGVEMKKSCWVKRVFCIRVKIRKNEKMQYRILWYSTVYKLILIYWNQIFKHRIGFAIIQIIAFSISQIRFFHYFIIWFEVFFKQLKCLSAWNWCRPLNWLRFHHSHHLCE